MRFKTLLFMYLASAMQFVPTVGAAQQHCMSGDLRCGGSWGGSAPAPAPVVFSNPLHDPNNPIYKPVAEDGPRCRELQLPGELCQQHNTDMKTNGCTGIDDPVISLLNQKGLAAGCQFSGGKLKFVYTCICGCFAPDTKIDAVEKATGVLDQIRVAELVMAKDAFDLTSISADASISALAFNASPIRAVSNGPTASPLLVIQTDNGKTLKLTSEHGVLLSSGVMITASNLKTGDSLLTREGNTVSVIQIGTEPYSGNVYNVETSGDLEQEHIIIAEGILVGDLAWQNKLKDQLGGVAIRK